MACLPASDLMDVPAVAEDDSGGRSQPESDSTRAWEYGRDCPVLDSFVLQSLVHSKQAPANL